MQTIGHLQLELTEFPDSEAMPSGGGSFPDFNFAPMSQTLRGSHRGGQLPGWAEK